MAEPLQHRVQFLMESQNTDGGWGYFPGRRSWLEPTAWAMLALHGRPECEKALETAWGLVRFWQLGNGACRPCQEVDAPSWVTSLWVTLHCVRQVNDVRLYRSAFQSATDVSAAQEDVRRAALGDIAAAVRIAHLHQRGEAGMAQDMNRYVGWLQYASMLGDDRASYELALHYRREAQPALAAKYEARAVELGFTPPRDLDHVRK